MELLIQVCKDYKKSPAFIFRCAYAHSGVDLCSELMEAEFKQCYIEDKDGMRWMIHVPQFVKDYCLSLLAKRISLPTDMEVALYK